MNKKLISITVLALTLLLMTSCNSSQTITQSQEPTLESIEIGERQIVNVVGKLQLYDHKNLKGRGLWEMVIGEKTLLIEGRSGDGFELNDSYLNKIVSAQIEITHYPLTTKPEEPISQKQGLWITKIKNIKYAK